MFIQVALFATCEYVDKAATFDSQSNKYSNQNKDRNKAYIVIGTTHLKVCHYKYIAINLLTNI